MLSLHKRGKKVIAPKVYRPCPMVKTLSSIKALQLLSFLSKKHFPFSKTLQKKRLLMAENQESPTEKYRPYSDRKKMDYAVSPLLFFTLFLLSSLLLAASRFPAPTDLQNLTSISFDEGYTQIFGGGNMMLLREGKSVRISLDERTGAGFASNDLFLHGFFSASIKLPSDYAAGVVVAFYMSNGDVFEKNHDELDFEFLGNIRGRDWRVQTNVYGNGSTGFGREERYGLWFDPTEDFHNYSILWSRNRIIFYIDGKPIREVFRMESMGGDFPSKPMSLYATIWDGSGWATAGGRYKVNYKYAPYVAEFADLVLHGCAVDPIDRLSSCLRHESEVYEFVAIAPEERSAMRGFRKRHMTYSYCYDGKRYKTPPPECSTYVHESEEFEGAGSRSGYRRRHGKHRRHQAVAAESDE